MFLLLWLLVTVSRGEIRVCALYLDNRGVQLLGRGIEQTLKKPHSRIASRFVAIPSSDQIRQVNESYSSVTR